MLNAKIIGLALATHGLVACASTARPQERWEASRADLAAAEAVDAQRVPKGALHLQLAREQIEKAKSLLDAGKNAEADYVLQRAQADAELAMAYAKDRHAQELANDMQDELSSLKDRDADSSR